MKRDANTSSPRNGDQNSPSNVIELGSRRNATDAHSSDRLAQAAAIIKSASCDAIDWSSEPLTERERRVRSKLSRTAIETFDWRQYPLAVLAFAYEWSSDCE